MNEYTRQAAIRAAAESIMTAFSPLRESGETAEQAAIRCIRANRADISNRSTRKQCWAFFDTKSRHFIGCTDKADQQAAILRSYPAACADNLKSCFDTLPNFTQNFYRLMMGEALFLAYRQAISAKSPHILLASHIGQMLEVYMEQRGDIFITYFIGTQTRADLYKGEEKEQASRAYSDFIETNAERKD